MSRQEIDMKSRIAFNIDAAMRAKEMTSAELARQLGLNEKTIRRWRNGEVTPGLERLAQLGFRLACDPMDFYREPERDAA